jgi:tRNA pseudouridine synthase 9
MYSLAFYKFYFQGWHLLQNLQLFTNCRRTHQIRLHLQYLGHPIGNDPNYGGELYYGNLHDKEMCSKAQERMNEIDADTNNTERPENSTSTDTPATEEELAKAGIGLDNRKEGESLLEYIKRTCVWCQRSKGEDRAVLEYLIRSPGIWLHALQYTLEGPNGTVCYRTNFPEWSLVCK